MSLPLVVDKRLEAGRGFEYSAAILRQQQDEHILLAELDGEDYRLPIDHRIEDNLELPPDLATMDTAIPEHNVGYKLLAKMGWTGGGLGREGRGEQGAGRRVSGTGRITRGDNTQNDKMAHPPMLWTPSLPFTPPDPTPPGRQPCTHERWHSTRAHSPPRIPRLAGIPEPLRVDAADNGVRLGLGRAEQDRQYTAAENIERRALEVELQAFEDEGRRAKREVCAWTGGEGGGGRDAAGVLGRRPADKA
jgi:hypothetical protein